MRAKRANQTEIERQIELAKKQDYREAHKDKIAAYQAQYSAATKSKRYAQRKQWREANPGTVKQRWAEYAETHRDELNAKARERQTAARQDPEKRAQINAAKRAYHQRWKLGHPQEYAAMIQKQVARKKELRALHATAGAALVA